MARAKTKGEEIKNTEAKADSKTKTKDRIKNIEVKPESKAKPKTEGVKAKPKPEGVKAKPKPVKAKPEAVKAKPEASDKPAKPEAEKPEISFNELSSSNKNTGNTGNLNKTANSSPPNPPSSSKSPYKVDAVLLQGLSIAGFKVLDKATGQTKNLNFTSFKARVEKGQIEGVKTVEYNGEEFYTGIDYKNLQVANMKADEKLLSLKTLKGLVVMENGSVLLI